MAHYPNFIKSPSTADSSALHFVRNRITDVMSKLKTRRARKTDIVYLSEYSDAELSDIGLLRSELSEALFEEAVDAQAQAMLRVYN